MQDYQTVKDALGRELFGGKFRVVADALDRLFAASRTAPSRRQRPSAGGGDHD